MKDWRKHWHIFPDQFDKNNYLEQVGKTVNKKPISREQFEILLHGIEGNLDTNANDDILDLCCGNGIITKSISCHCRTITGVDFSQTLIRVAKKYNSAKNIEYICLDVNEITTILNGKNFDKVYMYEALQHFNERQFDRLLSGLKSLMKNRFVLFIGSVPDKQRKRYFYDTIGRKFSYIWRTLNNNEAIGKWWDKKLVKQICNKNNLNVRFIKQSDKLYTGHYRFDMCISN